MVYEDFVIQVGALKGDGHTVQVLKSPAGEGRSSFRLPMSLAQIHEILTHWGSGVRGVPAEEAVATPPGRDLRAPASESAARLAPQQVGDQLFQGLFSGQVRSLYDQSLGTVGSRAGCGLRIKLKFDAQDQELAQLISVPWEFLWRRETHDFLSLSRLSPVVRYLDVPRPAVPISLESPLRVLVVVSSPPGLPPLNIKRERANLEETCRKWKGVEIVVLEGADSAAIRHHLLEKPFHVFHFIGHGGFDQTQGEGVLFFENQSGRPEPVTGQTLATFLKDFKTLGLVFLNACNTARTDSRGLNPFSGVAGALVLGGLPAVVAMQFPISDRAAIAFSEAFYQRLAIGDPVDASVVEGRQAILTTNPGTHEWGTPVLFVRVPDGTVFQSRQLRKGGGQDTASRPWPKLAAVLLLLLVVSLGIFSLPVFQRWAAGTSQGHVLEIEHEFGSSVNGLRGVLSTAEILPNGRMRLHFRFRNTSSKQVGLGLDYRSTYLADGAGNPYRVLATDATAATATNLLPPGGEIERWMEFPAPLDRARTFNVALAGRGQQEIRFPFFTIALPAYSPELSRSSPLVKPAPGALALAVTRAVATSVAGFKGELRGIELRPDGRMRWSFAFLNGSDHDQQVGFDYSGVYLVDEFGNRYSVLGSDTAGRPGQVYQESLPRALRADHWFDFPAPRNGAKSFKVVLASPGRTGLKFLPFDVRVPYYPERYSLPAQPSAPLARIEKPSNTKGAQPPVPPLPSQKTAQDAPPPTESQEAPVKPAAEPQKSVNHTTGQQKFETSIEGLSGSLVAVEGVGDGRLRWTIDLVNQSGGPVEIGFDAGETYLSDNLGHRYGVLRMDRPEDVFRDSLPAGARAVHWFDFPAPANGARRFFVVLASHSSQALRFVPFEVTLPGPK